MEKTLTTKELNNIVKKRVRKIVKKEKAKIVRQFIQLKNELMKLNTTKGRWDK